MPSMFNEATGMIETLQERYAREGAEELVRQSARNARQEATEKHIGWLCAEWLDASEQNTAGSWHDVRKVLHGASMALTFNDGTRDEEEAYEFLRQIAHIHCLDAIWVVEA